MSFFSEEGVDVSKLGDIHYKITNKVSCRLWIKLFDQTQDRNIGIKAGRFATPKIFNILGISMGLAHTPLEGMETMFRYFRLFSNAAGMYLVRVKAGYRLQINVITTVKLQRTNIDAFLSAFITICRQHYGDTFSPIVIKLPYSEGRDELYFQRFFRCSIEYTTNKFEMLFSKESMECNISNATGSKGILAPTISTKKLQDGLKKIDEKQLLEQAKIIIKQNLTNDNSTILMVSRRLNMSERTLQRRLSKHRYTFRNLTDECKKEVALDYVPNSDLSLTDISHLIGFSNYNNFSRAFKRWTGLSPKGFKLLN